MKYVIIGCFLILSNFSQAQEQDFFAYHKNISKAITLSLDSAYSESLAIFKNTFQEYGYRFANDVYVAAQVAAIQDSIRLSIYFLEEVFKSSAELKFIKRNTLFQQKFNSKQWSQIDFLAKSGAMVNRHRINLPLRNKVDSLIKKDQKYRNRAHSIFNFWRRKKVFTEWHEVTAQQVKEINKLIAIYGFPSYSLVGCDYKGSVNSNDVLYVLYHWPYSFSGVGGEDVLLKELKKGNIHLKNYMLLRDYEMAFYTLYKKGVLIGFEDLKETPSNRAYFYSVIWKASSEIITTINSKRAEMGYFTYQYSRKMHKAQMKYFKASKKEANNIDYLFYHL